MNSALSNKSSGEMSDMNKARLTALLAAFAVAMLTGAAHSVALAFGFQADAGLASLAITILGCFAFCSSNMFTLLTSVIIGVFLVMPTSNVIGTAFGFHHLGFFGWAKNLVWWGVALALCVYAVWRYAKYRREGSVKASDFGWRDTDLA